MTQCPKCGRAYAENFSYCLDDGTPLRHSTADEKTLVMPQSPQAPQPPPPTVPMQTPTPTIAPRVATPTTSSSTKSIFGAVALGVVGLFLVVFVWGAIKLGFWYLDRNQNSNQNSSSAPSSTATGPTPSPENPLTLLGASPSPSPESSSDVSATEGVITPGVYECEVTREVGEGTKQTIAIRLQITVSIDGTYHSQGFVTIPTANIRNLLGMEERGNYVQEGETLLLTNRRERELNYETGAWKPWTTPKDGKESREKVRNVTPNTYQLYDNEEGEWFTFSKV